jgi:hypothetical protein
VRRFARAKTSGFGRGVFRSAAEQMHASHSRTGCGATCSSSRTTDEQNHLFKKGGKDFDVSHQNPVVDRTGTGNNKPHPSKPQALHVLEFATEVIQCVIDPDVVSF